MWPWLGLQVLNLASVIAAPTTSTSKPTVTVTATAASTPVWVTRTADGSAYQVPYHQVFTAYFSEIASPRSGSIGLGWISGSVGSSRHYPLSEAGDAESLLENADNEKSSIATGPLVQSFSTDSLGRVQSGVPAAIGGHTQWFGPTITQASQDLTGWSSTTRPVYATAITKQVDYGYLVTMYDPDASETTSSARSRLKNPDA